MVDILFKDVAALAVAESFYSLEVSLADDEMVNEFKRFLRCEIPADQNLYVLRGADSVGYVVAGAMYWVDDPLGVTEERSPLIVNPARLGDLDIRRA